MSVSANPGTGRHRQFTEDDMAVLSLVAQMKRDNMIFADIHASLESGQRGNPPLLPVSEVEALVVEERETQLVAQIHKLEEIVVQLEQERDNLLPIRDENIRLKVRLEESEKVAVQLQTAQEEIKQLYRQIGTLEAQLARGKE
jgi:DNA-binding transcriptional MerR regulator